MNITWIKVDIVVNKVGSGSGPSPSIGLCLKRKFIPSKYGLYIYVESILPGSLMQRADIRKGDLLIAVDGTPVKTSTHAGEIFKDCPDGEISLTLERKSIKRNSQSKPSDGGSAELKVGKHNVHPNKISKT